MASIGHLLVGAALSAVPASGSRPLRALVLMTAALLPDADWLGYVAGVPYLDAFGHRGAAHSFAVAAGFGVVAGLLAGRRWGVLIALAMASHPVLDAMTDGGGGVAVFWPASDHRYFLPFRPIPVSPLGAGMLSARGLSVIHRELVLFSPLLLVELAHLAWRRRRAVSPG